MDINKFTMDFFSTLQSNQKKVAEALQDNDGEQRTWDEHKDECNGCAECEI